MFARSGFGRLWPEKGHRHRCGNHINPLSAAMAPSCAGHVIPGFGRRSPASLSLATFPARTGASRAGRRKPAFRGRRPGHRMGMALVPRSGARCRVERPPVRAEAAGLSVSAFRSDHLRWERRVIPTAAQYRNPAELACGATTHPSQAQIGFHAYGRGDYYLSHDWAPGRSPRDTAWSLLVGPPERVLSWPAPRSTSTPPSTTRPIWKPATWPPSNTPMCTGLATARARSRPLTPPITTHRMETLHERFHRAPRAPQRPDLGRPVTRRP